MKIELGRNKFAAIELLGCAAQLRELH